MEETGLSETRWIGAASQTSVSDIVVKEHNEVFVRVDCDRGIGRELHDHFSFYVPGYRFMPAYKSKMWNGKIYLYNLNTQLIYKGLLEEVKKFAKSRDYTIDTQNTDTSNEFSVFECGQFVERLKLPITPRDYQVNGFVHAIRNNRAVLLSPTGSGKSLMIYMISRFYPHKKLIIVPTISLVHQMAKDFDDYGNKLNVRMITGTTNKDWKEDITDDIVITTWQSVYKMSKNWFQHFGVVIGDEAHLFKAKSLTSILEKLPHCRYRFGFTGTLDGSETHQLILEGLFGPTKSLVKTKDLMENDQLAKLKIKILLLKYLKDTCQQVSKMKYADEMDFIVRNTKRNEFIKNLVLSLNGNTLILFQFVEKHGRLLYDMINSERKKRKVFFVFGGTDGETRESVREITEKETDAIIIASYGTFSMGINIKALHNIIFASPSKSKIRNLQSIGRGLRISDNKDQCTLFDIGDDLQNGKRANYTLKHLAERIKIYNQEKFNYKLYKINLES
jgi:superfamily II DNA or RNA helicase